MIIPIAFDVECMKNFFSITFVSIKDYFKIFSDCVDEKGRPVPMTDKLTVKEITDRLDKVQCKQFWITDFDDSQLLPLAAYLNNLQAKYVTTPVDGGNGGTVEIPVRHDLYGFNNKAYDNLMVAGFLSRFDKFDSTKLLLKWLYQLSQKYINNQDNRDYLYADKEIEFLKRYPLPYTTVDLQLVFALNSASVQIDKDSGERLKFGKSLKQTSINLKWYQLLDYTLPPINEEEREKYWSKDVLYKDATVKQLNSVITNDFDRYILPQYINPMMHYNKNDVFIVCEMARQEPDEIRLRYSLENAFQIPVLSSARSNISDKLLNKFYSKMSGLQVKDFIKKRTERTRLSFNKVIFPHIHFKTKQLQDLLNDMMQVYVYHTTKDDFQRVINFYGTEYTLACGGIHTKDKPAVLKSDDKYIYIHHDYTSYYPSIMVEYKIAPAHLNTGVFCSMVDYFRQTRIKAKHTKDEDGEVMEGVHNSITAQALKIVINAIYGKFGYERFWLYDRLAQLKVTINGQLMTMSLVEKLELAGIHVISANTDGIVLKLPNDKRDIYNQICKEWNEENRMSADDEEYKLLVTRDINNYFDIQKDGTIEYKGGLDPKQYIKDLKKGFDMPVVRTAVFEYFVHGTPVMETLRNHKDILDFCKTQNVGRQFEVVYDKVIDGKVVRIHSQRHVRFYVSTHGYIIMKENKNTNKTSRLASGLPVVILNTLDDKPIEERDINYGYYYREAYNIIDPIKLGISPQQKANKAKGIIGGKKAIKKYSRDYLNLFDNDE